MRFSEHYSDRHTAAKYGISPKVRTQTLSESILCSNSSTHLLIWSNICLFTINSLSTCLIPNEFNMNSDTCH